MSAEDATRWDARYSSSATAAPAAPDALIAAGLAELTSGMTSALDVACGAGAQSTWAALQGMDVTAVDVSTEAVRLTEQAAAAHGVGHLVRAAVVDLDTGLDAALDNVLDAGHTHFDLIVCQRFRDQRLYPEFVERLNVGGVAVVTVLSTTGADQPGAFHAPPGELRSAFDRPDFVELFHAEADGNESIVVRRLG